MTDRMCGAFEVVQSLFEITLTGRDPGRSPLDVTATQYARCAVFTQRVIWAGDTPAV